jgi:hypothetical protein
MAWEALSLLYTRRGASELHPALIQPVGLKNMTERHRFTSRVLSTIEQRQKYTVAALCADKGHQRPLCFSFAGSHMYSTKSFHPVREKFVFHFGYGSNMPGLALQVLGLSHVDDVSRHLETGTSASFSTSGDLDNPYHVRICIAF